MHTDGKPPVHKVFTPADYGRERGRVDRCYLQKDVCVVGLPKQNCHHKVCCYLSGIRIVSLKPKQKEFEPMFLTVQMGSNLSLEPLPWATRSSGFSFLWSLSSWGEWSNLSLILKLWLMRCVCDSFKVRWVFNSKQTNKHCRKGLVSGIKRWTYMPVTMKACICFPSKNCESNMFCFVYF